MPVKPIANFVIDQISAQKDEEKSLESRKVIG
jgi:hypothetical protein